MTNSADVPDSARPGQNVTLRVGAVDEMATRIQFQWLTDSISGTKRPQASGGREPARWRAAGVSPPGGERRA